MTYSFRTEIMFAAPHVTVHWDPELAGVVMHWQCAQGQDYRSSMDVGLDLLTRRGSAMWLADLRTVGVLPNVDKDWTERDWFPRAMRGGLRLMAIAVPEAALANMSMASLMSRVREEGLTTQYFKDVVLARTWLRDEAQTLRKTG